MTHPAAVERVVRAVLTASAGPLTPAEVFQLVRGFGHTAVTRAEVLAAIRRLFLAGRVRRWTTHTQV